MNERLRQAQIDRRWPIDYAARRIGVGRTTYTRWELGMQVPHDSSLMLACQAFNRSPEQLGFEKTTPSAAPAEESIPHIREQKTASEGRGQLSQRDESVVEQVVTSHLLTEEQTTAYIALLKIGEAIMFSPEKRATLQMLLAAIAMTAVKPQGLLQPETWQLLLSSETRLANVNETTIQGYAKLIEACWQLSKGNELALAEKLLPECMTRLVPLAQQPSKHQAAAAHLAAQGFRLYSIFALHQNNLLAMELYGKQAVQYGTLAGEPALLIPSFKGLGATYYYKKQYLPMLQTYKSALPYTERVSPLLQAAVYMGMAVAYAHMNQEQETLRYLGLASETFPNDPEADPNFAYAEFDFSHMILWEGIARSQLGQTSEALHIFHRSEQPGMAIPERVRIEIINHKAQAAIVAGDLEQSYVYIETGITGAKALGSQRRYNESHENFRQMRLIWPQEKRVAVLRELLH